MSCELPANHFLFLRTLVGFQDTFSEADYLWRDQHFGYEMYGFVV